LPKTGPDLVKFFHAAKAAGGDFMFKLPRIAVCILGCCLLFATPSHILAQAAAPAKPAVGSLIPPAQTYGKVLSIMEQQFVSAAEAMPEDKFNFAPPASLGEFKDVRTFAGQIKHVTEANYYFFHDPSQPMIDIRPDIEKLTTKADIVKALKDSFAKAHVFVDTITAENAFVQTAHGTRAEIAAFGIAHFMDHYGQIVVYLRMNGIVPPASRGAM
jgi:uncharacterized damage-inducible protein DinB